MPIDSGSFCSEPQPVARGIHEGALTAPSPCAAASCQECCWAMVVLLPNLQASPLGPWSLGEKGGGTLPCTGAPVSNCDAWSSNTDITWELMRNAESRTYWIRICIFRQIPGDSYAQ